jgi:hypothetical protein
MFDRKSDAELVEYWVGLNWPSNPPACHYWAIDETNNWLLEWRANRELTSMMILSVLDDDGHIVTRYEYERVVELNEEDGLYIKANLIDGGTTDEFVITFLEWCRAIPMVLSIDEDSDDSDTPATLNQTGPHEWTVQVAFKTGSPNYRTHLTIQGRTVYLKEGFTAAEHETVVQNMVHPLVNQSHEVCYAGGYDVFGLKLKHGVDTSIVAPELLFIELRIAGLQTPYRHACGQSLIRSDFDIEVLEEPGWYIHGRQGNVSNGLSFRHGPEDDEGIWTGEPMTGEPFGHPDYSPVPARWHLQFRNGQWHLRLGLGGTGGNHRAWYIFEQVLPDDRSVGLRPGSLELVCTRPWSDREPAADGSMQPPSDPSIAYQIDPVGKKVKLHVHGTEIFQFGSGDSNLGSRTLICEGANFGEPTLDRTWGNDSPPKTSSLILYNGNYDVTTHAYEYAFGSDVPRSDRNHELDSVVVVTRIFRGGYYVEIDEPAIIHPLTRAIELTAAIKLWDVASQSYTTNEVIYMVPTDDRWLLDDSFDDPIDWVNKDGVGPETMTTTRGWARISDTCNDYENVQVAAPVLQLITWKTEQFYLPRTDYNKWSRIVETEDDGRLMFVLEFTRQPLDSELFGSNHVGWSFFAVDAVDPGMAIRSLHRFNGSGNQHESMHGENPPFNVWRPRESNALTLIWHTEHSDVLPESVLAEPVESDSPRGTSTWLWSEVNDEWAIDVDNTVIAGDEGDRYIPWPPVDRGVNDGDSITTDSIHGYNGSGEPLFDDEAIWWSPDGVEWVLIIEGFTQTAVGGLYPTVPPAPTDPPTAEGDVYRALGIYPE